MRQVRGLVHPRTAPAGGVLPAEERRRLSRFRSRLTGTAGVAALLVVLAAWMLSPSVLGGKVMSADDLLYTASPFSSYPPAGFTRPSNPFLFDAVYVFRPDQEIARRDIRAGRLPLWTADQSAGRPLLAAQQSAALYPLNAPMYVLPFWRSQGYIALLKLVAAALGLFLLCRALALARGPALLGGVAYGFCAFMVSWLEHPHANVYLLLPWMLLMVERVCRRARWTDALGLGVAVGLAALGGHVESVVVIAPTVLAFAVYRLVALRGESPVWPTVSRRVLLLAGAVVLGLAIGAVMLVPFAEALGQSYDTSRSAPALARKALVSLALPEFWGRPDSFEVTGGPGFYPERVVYVGVVPLMLAAAGLTVRRPRGPQAFFLALAAVATVATFRLGPVTGWLRGLPALDHTNMTRQLIVLSLALAVLGAYGLQAALDGDRRVRLRIAVAAAVAGVLPGAVWLAKNASSLPAKRPALDQLPNIGLPAVGASSLQLATVLRWSGLAAVLVALLFLAVRRPGSARLLGPACVALAALDLVSMGRGYHPQVDKSVAQPPEPPVIRAMHAAQGHTRTAATAPSLGPNLPGRYGLRDIRGHELPVVERQQRLWTALGGSGFQRTELTLADPRTRRLLDVFGARQVFTPAGTKGAPDPSLKPGLIKDGQVVLRNTDALPRAWVAYGWRPAHGLQDALARTTASSITALRDAPLVEGGGPPPAGAAPVPATPARVRSETDTGVDLDVRARRPGRLVLDDTFYPGWKATVDGHDADVHAANTAFRAVAVPAGRHRVRFEYRPASVRVGGALTLLSVLASLAAGAFAPVLRRRRRRV